MDRKYRQYLIPVLLVCCAVAADVMVRFPYFKRMLFYDALTYSLSIIFETALALVFLRFIRKSAIPGYLFIMVYLLGTAACYTFYIYFKALPGINTFSYMFLEPEDFFGIARDGINIWLMLPVGALLVSIWRPVRAFIQNSNPCPNRAVAIVAAVLILSAAVLNQAISRKDNRALPITNSLFSIINGYRDFRHDKLASFELMHRSVSLKQPDARKKPEFNLLVVINESLSAEYLKEYGYPLNTTPRLSDFFTRHRSSTFIYPRAFSNSTVTKVSVPYLMTGLNPIEGRYQLGKSPLFFEILKANLATYRTGLMTSWSYKAANFVEFMDSPYLDYYRYLENSGAKKVCNLSADDSLITAYFRDFLDNLGSSEKFCAVLHYANTHFPYYSKPGDLKFVLPNRQLSNYLGAVHNLDRNISGVLDILENRNILDNTIILFTSDHGESFGEVQKRSGHLGMFTLYTTRVPLWIYIPERILDRRPEFRTALEGNLTRNICNSDIFSTVLALYGLEGESISRFGKSLLSDIPENRDIFIFNGLREDRAGNQEYIGIIRKDDFFVVSKETDYGQYYLFNLKDSIQTRNLWGETAMRDSCFIASLRRENLETFILEPPKDERLFLALMEGRRFGEFLKTRLNFDIQMKER